MKPQFMTGNIQDSYGKECVDFADPFMGYTILIAVDAYLRWIKVYVKNLSAAPDTIERNPCYAVSTCDI